MLSEATLGRRGKGESLKPKAEENVELYPLSFHA